MSHLVGASLLIPGDAWSPQQDHPIAATVFHFARATRGYPEGRVRVICEDGTDLWWDVSKLPAEWVIALADDPSAVNLQAMTPSRAGRRSVAATPGTTGRTRGRPRKSRAADGYDSTGGGLLSDTEGAGATNTATPRLLTPAGPSALVVTATATTAAPLPASTPLPPLPPLDTSADVFEILPDNDGAAAADGAARTGTPNTGTVRRRGRSRKSIRFAPGTVSPGAHATAAASVIHSSPLELLHTPLETTNQDAMNADATSPAYLASPLTSPRASDGGHGDYFPTPVTSAPAAAAAGPHAYCGHEPCYSSAPPRLPLTQRLRNIALILLVTLPALYFHRQLHYGCSEEQRQAPLSSQQGGHSNGSGCTSTAISGGSLGSLVGDIVSLLPGWWPAGGLAALTRADFWCAVGYQQPLLAVNLVFLLNVDVLFWYIGLLQGSTWLIDPFWTLAPLLIGIFYQLHPAAVTQPLRSRLAMGLLWVWAVRLTHSYFRREEWQVGAREDWRYARMSRRLGRLRWAVASFFVVGLAQHLMLVGLTLPLLAVHSSDAAWNPRVDVPIFLAAATGIMIALVADNQLRDFMVENERRERQGRPRLLLLDTGLWRYSRHPNFFGEQLWWWSLALWAVVCGRPWMVVGAAFNTLCFISITRMAEARMLERPERAALYRHYQRTTSVWVPWFRRAVVVS